MDDLKAKGAKMLEEIMAKFEKFIVIATKIEEMRCVEERECPKNKQSPCATTLSIFTMLQAFISTVKDFYSPGQIDKPLLPDSIDILDDILQNLEEYSENLECYR